ncbi:hypothetical protein [Jannaschia sp. LMIT008]|uniref:hypothetical protein n=1 Tax=Jannaschia maritima TaxID=3032585 RepID=UPI002812560A|nr:hypothetical protein [Jannaschia sp. LMIT008]
MIDGLAHRFYLHGYQGKSLPKGVCRILARSVLHRAWFAGRHGCFEQDGITYGLGNPYPGTFD